MTNVSFYAYKDVQEYMSLYPGGQDKLTEDHLSALFINKKNVVFVSDSKKDVAGYKPDFSKSIIYFDGGLDEWNNKYDDNFEPIVEVKINGSFVRFIGQEVAHEFVIAKFVGKIEEHCDVKGYILYDEEKTRLNLITNTVPTPIVENS